MIRVFLSLVECDNITTVLQYGLCFSCLLVFFLFFFALAVSIGNSRT